MAMVKVTIDPNLSSESKVISFRAKEGESIWYENNPSIWIRQDDLKEQGAIGQVKKSI